MNRTSMDQTSWTPVILAVPALLFAAAWVVLASHLSVFA
jgi:hypothetical protein